MKLACCKWSGEAVYSKRLPHNKHALFSFVASMATCRKVMDDFWLKGLSVSVVWFP